jgi:hypothetical protein
VSNSSIRVLLALISLSLDLLIKLSIQELIVLFLMIKWKTELVLFGKRGSSSRYFLYILHPITL